MKRENSMWHLIRLRSADIGTVLVPASANHVFIAGIASSGGSAGSNFTARRIYR